MPSNRTVFPPARIPQKGQHVARQAASANLVRVESRNARAWHQIALFLTAGADLTELATAEAAPAVLKLAFEPVGRLTCM
jgi:hypothetical protein